MGKGTLQTGCSTPSFQAYAGPGVRVTHSLCCGGQEGEGRAKGPGQLEDLEVPHHCDKDQEARPRREAWWRRTPWV